MNILYTGYFLVCSVIALPVLMFTIECIVGTFRSRFKILEAPIARPKVAILIPAHNEEEIINQTLTSLQAQTQENDRVLVIADNCNDKTAEIVRSFGFEVSERFHDSERGKGFALAHGLAILANDQPEIVIILDADCLLGESALDQLIYYCDKNQSPVQAQYLIKTENGAKTTTRVSEFAVYIKNKVRMLGLARLGSSVHLSGTGMAFPYDSLAKTNLASGEIVEDMKLGVDLAIAKRRVLFIDHVEVESFFPTTTEALAKQRERWEHGHLGLIQRYVPKLITSSLNSKNPRLLLLALDLVIPPLAFLIAIMLGLFGIGALLSLVFSNLSFVLAPSALLFVVLSITLFTWFFNARHILSVSDLIAMPVYMLKKIGSYLKFFKGREQKWVKTDRK